MKRRLVVKGGTGPGPARRGPPRSQPVPVRARSPLPPEGRREQGNRSVDAGPQCAQEVDHAPGDKEPAEALPWQHLARVAQPVERTVQKRGSGPVSYTHLRAHETDSYLV